MKILLPVVIAIAITITSAAPLSAQESVTVNEPTPQCYDDLKLTLPEAIRWDDEHMMVRSRPLMTTMSGNVEVVARILQEYGQDKKTKERVEMCRIVVSIDAPVSSTAWNDINSGRLFQMAGMMKARIESVMKARAKKNKG